jgi:Cation transport protein
VGAVLVSNIFMMVMFLTCSAHLVRCAEPKVLGAQSPSNFAPPPPPGYSPLPGSLGGPCYTQAQMLYLTFFQVANVRSSGLQVFDLKRISKNMLVIFAFFMWYAPTPLVSIIAGEEFNMAFHDNPILSGFIKKYTNRHTSWIMVAFIIISTAEQEILAESGNWPACVGSAYDASRPDAACFSQPFTTLFNIIFEMLSAYGTNGLSMGFPGVNHSLSGKFKYSVSKLSIMFLMIMGRHRSMSGKSDPTLMPSMRRVQEHVERLKAQRTELAALRVAAVPEEAAKEAEAVAVAVAATRGELVLEMAELAPHE